MATGKLGAEDLAAATPTVIYTVPDGQFTVASINICNRNTSNVLIKIAIADADTPAAGEYIEFDAEILPNGVLERTGIVMNADQRVVVEANAINVSANAFGIETSVS